MDKTMASSIFSALKETLLSDQKDINAKFENEQRIAKECRDTKDAKRLLESNLQLQYYLGMLAENKILLDVLEQLEKMGINKL